MALVWFVDKSPRSRKPVQYKRLDDFKGPMSETAESDLLPVLLPCALCCAQQQLTASLVAHQLQQKNHQKILAPPQTETSQYSEFLSLCQHVECLVEKSMARMNGEVSSLASHSALIRNPIKLKGIAKLIVQSERVCLKGSIYILFEILAPRTWKGSTIACQPIQLNCQIGLARPVGACKALPCLIF